MATRLNSREITLSPSISASQYSSGDQLGGLEVLEIGLCDFYLTELERATIVDTSDQKSSITLLFFDSLPTINSSDNQPLSIGSQVLADKLLSTVTIDATQYISTSGVAIANATFGNVNLKASPYSPGKLYCVAKVNGTPTYQDGALSLKLSFVQYQESTSTGGTGAGGTITNSEMDLMGGLTVKGNNTLGAAKPLDLSTTEVTAMLNVFQGDTGSGGAKGLVPATQNGDSSKFLSGSGTWKEVSKSLPVRTISSSANVLNSDYYIGCTNLSSQITITLPNLALVDNGQIFVVKDEEGMAGTYPISVYGNGASIDGESTYILNAPMESLEVIARETYWCIK